MLFRSLSKLSLENPASRTQLVLRPEFVDRQLRGVQLTSVKRNADWPLSSAAVVGLLGSKGRRQPSSFGRSRAMSGGNGHRSGVHSAHPNDKNWLGAVGRAIASKPPLTKTAVNRASARWRLFELSA